MKKKLIALLCAATMVVSLAACGAKDTPTTTTSETVKEESKTSEVVEEVVKKDPVTIVYWYRNNCGEQEYTKEVNDKLNEMLAANEATAHITLELHPCKDYPTEYSLGQAGGEQMDIISTPGLSNYSAEVANGSFMPLDDIIAQVPEAVEDLPEWLVGMGKGNDGVQWIVPNYQEATNMQNFIMPVEYMEMAGLTVEDITDVLYAEDRTVDSVADMLEKILLAVREKTGKEKVYSNSFGDSYFWLHNNNQEVFWNNASYFYWDMEDDSIGYSLLHPTVLEAGLKTAEFYDKGYILPDIDTVPNLNAYTGKDGTPWTECEEIVVWTKFAGVYGDIESTSEYFSKSYGIDVVAIPLVPYNLISSRWAAGGMAISSTCENPVEAMQIISMLTNSKYSDFYNTIVYGIEGIHYNKISDGIIETTEYTGAQGNAECTYTYFKWAGGNIYNSWCNQSATPELRQYTLNEINESPDTMRSPFIGWTFDCSSLDLEKTQIVAVAEEYQKALRNGILGLEKTKAYQAEFIEKVKAAGIDKVLDELNAQAEAYLKK